MKASASAPEPMSSRWIFLPSAPTRRASKVSLARRRQRRDQRPVFAGDELLDLELAVADEPQRHRLHPAGRARARQLAPQHRREREADEIVERAAGEIGVDQRAVDLRAGASSPRCTACLVMALNTTRSTVCVLSAFFSLSTSSTCQEIASPSRSGSVARISLSAPLTARGDVVEPLLRLGVDLPDHAGNRRRDRPSRPWPAGRGHGRRRPGPRSRRPRYLLIVLALAGDSTTTMFMEFHWVSGRMLRLNAGRIRPRLWP